MAKARATTEELIKVLDYTLVDYQKSIEKSKKEIAAYLQEFKIEIKKGQSIDVQPDLRELEKYTLRLDSIVEIATAKLKRSFDSIFLSPFVLGLICVVFLSGVGLLGYSFTLIEKAKAIENSQQRYVDEFFEAKPKALELFLEWKKERNK